MAKTIEHSGIIDSISDDVIKVKIVQNSACSGCTAKQLCNAAEQKEKIVDVYQRDPLRQYKVGEEVTVAAGAHVGKKAVLLAFVYPSILMLLVIFATNHFTGSETSAALSGFVVLIPYIIFLYAIRDKLKSEFSFWIK